MRKQNIFFRTRDVPFLLLTLALISGLAQTTQYAYTANALNIVGTPSISKIQTSIDSEILTMLLTTNANGIAITDDDSELVVTLRPCTGSCVLRVKSTDLTITASINVSPVYYVAITPRLSVPQGVCRYAYVTSTQAQVYAIPLTTAVCGDTQVRTITLGGSTWGVATANLPDGSTEVWVNDFNNARVFVIDPLSFAQKGSPVQLACPGGCPMGCPNFAASPVELAFASISSSEYRMYVTDGTGGNNAVWPIKNTSQGREVLCPMRWVAGFCNIVNTAPWAIDVNSKVTSPPTAGYMTAIGVDNRIYSFSIPGNMPTCFPNVTEGYPAGTFSLPTGVAWLANGRAYVANSTDRRVTAIQQNPNDRPNPIALVGSPQSVTITSGIYSTALPGPSPAARVR